jgi:hypothetical protein
MPFSNNRKEASYGSIIGPFESNPFDCQFKISPVNSVTKKDSSERRVILDLSFPPGCSGSQIHRQNSICK